MKTNTIILAAGKGTRMKSNLPKVLHPIGGKPMIKHVTELAQYFGDKPIVVFGHKGNLLQQALSDQPITWIEQSQQLGTGHAVLQTLDHLNEDTLYLIMLGDAPLLRKNSLLKLAHDAQTHGIAVLTVTLDNPTGYGRIVRDDNNTLIKIVEEKDANIKEKSITEVNSGVFAVSGHNLKQLLPQIQNDNAQGEFYFTDIIELACKENIPVVAHCIDDATEVQGCNDKVQLAKLERLYQQRKATELMIAGATLADPQRIDIRGSVTVGMDCFIDSNAIFIGNVVLGDNVTIGANCQIENSTIASNTTIFANSIIESSNIGESAHIGPFARLRPNTKLSNNTKIGNFVETKNASIACGSKVNHLSYIGDAVIEENVNIGAGTITCNYDGANKHKTTIESGSFIGSNSALVAPVIIAKDTTVAAGSTITKNTIEKSLTIARSKQKTINNWQKPVKKN